MTYPFDDIDCSDGGDTFYEGMVKTQANLTEAETQIDAKADAGHSHGAGGEVISIVAAEANLGTGSTDGEMEICSGSGNRYTWDDGNSKWRVIDGNKYTTAALPTTAYTIATNTLVVDTTTANWKRWNGTTFEVAGDCFYLEWNPSYSTPATTPAQVSNADQLTAHLYGIDLRLGGLYTAKTADYTLGTAGTDLQGGCFSNDGAVAAINFTWPTLVVGQIATFYVSDAQYLKITAPTGKAFREGSTTSANAGYIRCNTVGGWVRVSVNTTDNLSCEFLSSNVWTKDA